MAHSEMTIEDILKDSLIRQMMRADETSSKEMKTLLQAAALRGRARGTGAGRRDSSPAIIARGLE